MKRNYIILLAALLTVACAGNGDTVSPTPQEGEILFSGSTVGPKVRTSYEDTETALRVNWVKNDLIGLFAESGGKNLGANFAYKAAVSGATSDFTAASRLNVIRWADETSDHDFYAYYPYREEFTAGSSFTFTVQSDQSAGRNYTNSDLMSAVRQNVAPTADAVELTFSHRLTRLDIELMPGEGFAAADELKGATVTAKNVKSSCLFNLSDGSVSEAGTPADLTPRGNGAKVTGEAIEPMQLIVVPQTLAAGEILFEIALGDETFFYAPNEELVLDGGKYYRFEIRLNRTNVSATSVRITSMPL